MSALKTSEQSAKKPIKILAYLLFTMAYAAFLSLGMECMLNLLSFIMSMGIPSDGPANPFPRFIPFCIVVGFLALVALVLLVILNIKASKKLDYTERVWCIQSILAFVVSLPMIKLWEILFDYLHKVF